jgi:hypothetical protein
MASHHRRRRSDPLLLSMRSGIRAAPRGASPLREKQHSRPASVVRSAQRTRRLLPATWPAALGGRVGVCRLALRYCDMSSNQSCGTPGVAGHGDHGLRRAWSPCAARGSAYAAPHARSARPRRTPGQRQPDPPASGCCFRPRGAARQSASSVGPAVALRLSRSQAWPW